MSCIKSKFLKSLIVILGSLVMGAGVAIAVCGRQGADPLAVVWDGMSNVFPITVGQANVIISIILFIIVFIFDRKQLSWGTILNPIFCGISTDFVMSLVSTPSNIYMQIAQSILGVIIIGIGVGIYTSVDFGKGTYDALVFGISNKLNIPFFIVRMISDGLMLITGYLMGGKIGLSTVFAVFCIGKIISLVYEKSKMYELKFLSLNN